MEGIDHAGYFDRSSLSSYHKYQLLKKLRQLGWVHPTADRVLHHRNFVTKDCDLSLEVSLPPEVLESKESLKIYILQEAERYSLQLRYKQQSKGSSKFDYREGRFNKRERILRTQRENVKVYLEETPDVQRGDIRITGSVPNKLLANWLGCSPATVKRSRRTARHNNYCQRHKYFYKTVQCHPTHKGARYTEKHGYVTTYLNIYTDVTSYVNQKRAKNFIEGVKKNPLGHPLLLDTGNITKSNQDFANKGLHPCNSNVLGFWGEEYSSKKLPFWKKQTYYAIKHRSSSGKLTFMQGGEDLLSILEDTHQFTGGDPIKDNPVLDDSLFNYFNEITLNEEEYPFMSNTPLNKDCRIITYSNAPLKDAGAHQPKAKGSLLLHGQFSKNKTN